MSRTTTRNHRTTIPNIVQKFIRLLDYYSELLYPRPYADKDFSCLPVYQYDKDNKFALLPYQQRQFRRIIHYLKHHNDYHLAETLAGIVHYHFLASTIYHKVVKNNTKVIIIAMPTSAKRFREEGFNHVDTFALILARLFDVPIAPATYIRKSHRKKQALLPRQERLLNQRGTFQIINQQAFAGMTCIIVDDVFTTGATIDELSQVLIDAGAHQTLAITLAH